VDASTLLLNSVESSFSGGWFECPSALASSKSMSVLRDVVNSSSLKYDETEGKAPVSFLLPPFRRGDFSHLSIYLFISVMPYLPEVETGPSFPMSVVVMAGRNEQPSSIGSACMKAGPSFVFWRMTFVVLATVHGKTESFPGGRLLQKNRPEISNNNSMGSLLGLHMG
jgi:hypothetical protein